MAPSRSCAAVPCAPACAAHETSSSRSPSGLPSRCARSRSGRAGSSTSSRRRTRRWSPSCPRSSRRSTSSSATSRTRSRWPTRRPPGAGLVKVGKTVDFGDTQLWTRVNSLDSPWGLDDLTTLVTEIGDKLDVIMIPKVEGPEDIHYVDRLLAQLEAKAGLTQAAAGPRDPRDRPRRGQRRGDLRRLAAHAGPVARAGRPRREPADEDHPRRRRPPRLPRPRRPRPGATPTRRGRRTSRTCGTTRSPRMVDACVMPRDPPVLRAVRRHQGRRRLRGPVPQRLPARLRRRVEPAPGADRDRQAGVQPAARRRRPGPAGDRRDGRRHRRDHARRQDGGRRLASSSARSSSQLARRSSPPAIRELAAAYGFAS